MIKLREHCMLHMDPTPLFEWANEREALRIKKDCNAPQPWTEDNILRTYRFCNVYREEDRVTKWIKENVRDPHTTNRNLWFMLVIARVINWPDTLKDIIYEGGWPFYDYEHERATRLAEIMQIRKNIGLKVYTSAYMTRAESNPAVPWYSWTKQQYVAHKVFGGVWERKEILEEAAHMSIEAFTDELVKCYGIGPFIAYQVAVDLTWCEGWLDSAPDLNSYAKIGPGTRRGLNRLAGREVTATPPEEQLLAEARYLYEVQGRYLEEYMRPIRLSDITNCCCETDKYLRVKNGEGKPRNKYVLGRGY